MIRHLLKIVWNRKTSNLLIAFEIAVSFLVVFFVASFFLYYADNYRNPLGFEYENVWQIEIDRKELESSTETAKTIETTKRVLETVRSFEEVEAAAGLWNSVFTGSMSTRGFDTQGRKFSVHVNSATDDLPKVLGIKMLEGRWFDSADDGAAENPVVVNRKFSRMLFGNESPIGKLINPDGKKTRFRVIGVVEDYRDDGELAELRNHMFEREPLDAKQPNLHLHCLVIKVRPGTTAAFEEKLLKGLNRTAGDWSFSCKTLTANRENVMRKTLTPLLTGGVIAVFLMIMVGLGLTGVLWQSVTQRTREMGLRRAKGATKVRIHRQILGELLILTTVSLTVGVVIAVQLPLLGLLTEIGARVFAAGVIGSALFLAGLTTLCGYYPSRLATRVPPAEALHYE